MLIGCREKSTGKWRILCYMVLALERSVTDFNKSGKRNCRYEPSCQRARISLVVVRMRC
jgi:hypothetical protein